MATIDSLANETLSDIMEMLKEPSLTVWQNGEGLPTGRYDALRAAALVCSRWRDPAQRALFDSLLLRYQPQVSRSPEFAQSPARLRYRTRSLDVVGHAQATSPWLEVAHEAQGVESLQLRTIGGGRDDTRVSWGVLGHPCFAGLKHLSIARPENFRDPTRAGVALLARLITLRLWLYCDDNDFDVGLTSPAFISALFATSSDSLRTLHLRLFNQRAESPLLPSFHLVAAHLRRLILESAHDSFAGHLNLLTLCTSIEHLDMRFDFDNNDSSGSISPLHLGAILDALPPNPTLRRLSISLESSTGLEGIISLLSHTSISLLDTLSFPDLAPVVKHSEGPGTEAAELRGGHEARILAAREACEERGIRMTLKGE